MSFSNSKHHPDRCCIWVILRLRTVDSRPVNMRSQRSFMGVKFRVDIEFHHKALSLRRLVVLTFQKLFACDRNCISVKIPTGRQEGIKMKKILLIALAVIITWTTIPIAGHQALAEDGNQTRGLLLATLSTSGNSCEQVAVTGSSTSSALACRSNAYTSNNKLMAAVSCGSNQWCCKHDFSKGTCVKCCSK